MAEVVAELLAGTTAGAASVLVDYPLDTLKTRMQVLGGSGGRASPKRNPPFNALGTLASRAAHPSHSPLSACRRDVGYTACIHNAWREGGVAGFYRGVSIPLLAQGAENAIVFTVFAVSLRRLEPYFQARRSVHTDGGGAPAADSPIFKGELWCAAAAAGATVSFLLTPVEFVKGNMQVRCYGGKGVVDFCKAVYARHGLLGFYVGFAGTSLRAVAGNAAYFLTYKQLLHTLQRSRGGDRETGVAQQPAAWQCVVAGGISGTMYWSLCYPIDMAKTQLQIQAGAAVHRDAFSCGQVGKRSGLKSPGGSLLTALGHRYREGGLRALYRGWGVTTLRAFVSSAVVFTVYERAQPSMANSCRAANNESTATHAMADPAAANTWSAPSGPNVGHPGAERWGSSHCHGADELQF